MARQEKEPLKEVVFAAMEKHDHDINAAAKELDVPPHFIYGKRKNFKDWWDEQLVDGSDKDVEQDLVKDELKEVIYQPTKQEYPNDDLIKEIEKLKEEIKLLKNNRPTKISSEVKIEDYLHDDELKGWVKIQIFNEFENKERAIELIQLL